MLYLKRIQIQLRARQRKTDQLTIKNSLTDKNIESKKSMDMKDSVRAKISDKEKTSAVPDAKPYD